MFHCPTNLPRTESLSLSLCICCSFLWFAIRYDLWMNAGSKSFMSDMFKSSNLPNFVTAFWKSKKQQCLKNKL